MKCAAWGLVVVSSLLGSCNAILGVHDFADATPTGCAVDTDCADPYSVCIAPSCVCSAGYVEGPAGCVWAGVVGDPGFGSSTIAWDLGSGASIAPAADGGSDAGEVELSTGACGPFQNTPLVIPSFSQVLTMPRASRSEALMWSVLYEDYGTDSFGFGQYLPLATELGAPWTVAYPLTSAYATASFCLGAGQYAPASSTGIGSALTLGVIGDEPGACNGSAAISRIDIAPAPDGACPALGTVLDGSCDPGSAWQLTGSSGSATVGYADDGSNGTSGIQLTSTSVCVQPTASTLASVPLPDATGAPVLTVYHRSLGGGLHLRLDGHALPPSSDASGTVDRYCVPPYMDGGVFTFSAWIGDDSKSCTSTTDLGIIDDVGFATDPACGGDPGVADPSFEATSERALGFAETDGTAGVVALGSAAHTGSNAAQLAITKTCGQATLTVEVVTPLSVDGAGPALTFWYQKTHGGTAYAESVMLTEEMAWTQATVCLGYSTGSLPQQVEIELDDSTTSGTGSACGKSLGASAGSQELLIDDLATTTSTQCAGSGS